MSINGGVRYVKNAILCNIQAMQMQTHLLGITNENVAGFDKVGYQRKVPVVSSFAEFIGPKALSTAVDDTVGRLNYTGFPLDIALAEKGYFQIETQDGIKLTRDGRFKMTKDGRILDLDGNKVLSNTGTEIILPFVPEKVEDITVDLDGTFKVFNRKTNKFENGGTLSVVTSKGVAVLAPNVRQGFNEYSNVSLQTEFMEAMPYQRNFDANRQLFQIQNTVIQKAISTLST